MQNLTIGHTHDDKCIESKRRNLGNGRAMIKEDKAMSSG
jgi:hypothetical protein